jgi:uncharacterized protein
MPAVATIDPILKRFRAALHELYGDWAERVVLYGSRTRGDAYEDSDYDVAVFLRDMADRAAEMDRLAYNEATPLMHEIRMYGVDL